MKPSQIIALSAQKHGIPYPVALKTMEKAIQEPASQLMQHNNTLMYIKMLGTAVAKVFFVSTDSPLTLVQSINYFVTMLKTNKIQMIYMNLGPQDDILTALHSNGVDVKKSTNPQYQLEARV
jgi:hypothetical protein